MTQEQAIQRGFTHFIEVFRHKSYNRGQNMTNQTYPIEDLDRVTDNTKKTLDLYTVAIFLIKPKLK
jgi:hypothetical protein